MRGWTRRSALAALGASALSVPLLRRSRAEDGVAKRVVFFYFPDGVPGASQDGEASLWHPTGSTFDFQLGSAMAPLERWKDRSVFFRGLSMGPTDSGSHPGGAKKLLTARDGGGGESIDQFLSRTAGASDWYRHLVLGVQTGLPGMSSDRHIVYPAAGQTLPPEDDPLRAFTNLFGTVAAPSGDDDSEAETPDPVRGSVIDAVLDDVSALRARLPAGERSKLDLHLEALRELELRIGAPPKGGGGSADPAACESPWIDGSGFSAADLYAPEAFPAILRAQLDLAVLAMACGLTRVATIQCSVHTSELIMSRFPATDFSDPGYDMRSHQASHYGARHDWNSREFTAFFRQRVWWAEQFAGLLDRLDAIPDGDGTMLDTSLCVLVTEVSDGNTHLHDDMPFVLAGGGGGRVSGGRLLDAGYRRHGDLWAAVAQAMGQDVQGFGDASSEAFPGLLG